MVSVIHASGFMLLHIPKISVNNCRYVYLCRFYVVPLFAEVGSGWEKFPCKNHYLTKQHKLHLKNPKTKQSWWNMDNNCTLRFTLFIGLNFRTTHTQRHFTELCCYCRKTLQYGVLCVANHLLNYSMSSHDQWQLLGG